MSNITDRYLKVLAPYLYLYLYLYVRTCRYSHPYLPGLHTSIHIEDFLWTGEGEGQENGIEEEQAQEGRSGVEGELCGLC